MGTVLKNLDWSVLTGMLINIIPALICITFHETAHGYVAYRLGDDTAKRMGRLTLNPIRHIDWMGLLAMAVFRFGWARPVPVDMRNFKDPKRGMAVTALAGPVSNFLLTAVAMFLYGALFTALRGRGAGDYILRMLYALSYMSTALAIFNFIPIPPLDGSKVLFSFIPDSGYMKLMRYERYGMLLIILFVAVFNDQFSAVVSYVYDKLFFIAEAGYRLAGSL